MRLPLSRPCLLTSACSRMPTTSSRTCSTLSSTAFSCGRAPPVTPLGATQRTQHPRPPSRALQAPRARGAPSPSCHRPAPWGRRNRGRRRALPGLQRAAREEEVARLLQQLLLLLQPLEVCADRLVVRCQRRLTLLRRGRGTWRDWLLLSKERLPLKRVKSWEGTGITALLSARSCSMVLGALAHRGAPRRTFCRCRYLAWISLRWRAERGRMRGC